MNKVFDVYLAKTDVPGSEAYARLDLPALPWALLDALDKLRLRDGEKMYLEIDNYYDFGFLAPYFEDKPCNLYELNSLALKLGELDARHSAAFEGLVKVEVSKAQGPLSMPRLIDLAYSADCCHVVPEANNDFELGGFYAGNGFDVLQARTRVASSCGSCHDCAREVFDDACAAVAPPVSGQPSVRVG